MSEPEAPYDCALCPRLSAFVRSHRAANPTWFNGPVRSFGSDQSSVLIVGLAPGLRGANRTGRPFTGDFAGDLLYTTLKEYRFASGEFEARPDDSLVLDDCMITNVVRCVPPENKPTPAEINTCRTYLSRRIIALPNLRAIVCLGRISHDSTLSALAVRRSQFPFAHGAIHHINPIITVFDSYHCSRYNTNTGVLTTDMFRSVFAAVRTHIDSLAKG